MKEVMRESRGPCVLALETSGDEMILALAPEREEASWRFVTLPGGAATSSTLLPALAHLCAQNQMALADMDVIAFGQGPGSFTGVRTACAIAQGLALGCGASVVAIDSLQAWVQSADELTLVPSVGGHALSVSVRVVIDARMNEIYTALYQKQGVTDEGWSVWAAQESPRLITPDALRQLHDNAIQNTAADPPVWIGNALQVYASALTSVTAGFPESVALARSRLTLQGKALLKLAWQAIDAQQTFAPQEAAPVYVRDKVAQTMQERQQLSQSKAATPGASP